MKPLPRLICVLAVTVCLPVANLFGVPYLEDSPVSASGDASANAFEFGMLSTEELSREFADDSSASTSSAPAASDSAAAGTEQQVGVEVSAGSFEVQGQEADIFTVKIPYSRRLNERATLELAVPVSFTVYSDAIGPKDGKAYGVGLNAGYAWQAFLKKDNVPYRWKLTPSAGLYYRDSNDMNVGSWVFNTGFSSSFAWKFSPGWVVNVGNSISFAWHNGIKDYADPIRDDQQTLKNGIQLHRMLDRWTLSSYLTHTQALNDMIVDSYRTYGLSAAYKLTKTRTLKASLYYEEGNGDYQAVRGTLGSTWSF